MLQCSSLPSRGKHSRISNEVRTVQHAGTQVVQQAGLGDAGQPALSDARQPALSDGPGRDTKGTRAHDDMGATMHDIVSAAFAGDDVAAELERENAAVAEESMAGIQEPEGLPGWGLWANRKREPQYVSPPHVRLTNQSFLLGCRVSGLSVVTGTLGAWLQMAEGQKDPGGETEGRQACKAPGCQTQGGDNF
jgi:Utp14 protein